jgi:phosphocarrier protein
MQKTVVKLNNSKYGFSVSSFISNRNSAGVLPIKTKCAIFFYGTYTGGKRGSKMSRKNVIVSNVSEGHDNPIAELVQVACRFDSEITLENDNHRINAKSIMGIMAFNPSEGMSIDIVTTGRDEAEALDAIEKFLVCE